LEPQSDQSLRRKLRSTLESRNMPALQQVLEAATQCGLRGAEVERAKQLLKLLAAACPTNDVLTQPQLHGTSIPRAQPQLHAVPHSSSGGCVVPTQPQVHAARGSSGGGMSPTHSKVDAAPTGSSGSSPTGSSGLSSRESLPRAQWIPGGHIPTDAMMQHAASSLCGYDWKPGYGMPGSSQLQAHLKRARMRETSTYSSRFLSEMPAAKHGDCGKCWCDEHKRMQFDKIGRPWRYKCAKCCKTRCKAEIQRQT